MATRIQYTRSQFGKCWLACLLATGWFLFACTWAWGHETGTGWSYDSYCCNRMDCRPARPGEVQFTPLGWDVDGETIPEGDSRIRPSGDRMIHVCREMIPDMNRKWRCLYLPKGEG